MSGEHDICKLEIQVGRLEERLQSSDKALEIAKQAVDKALNVSRKDTDTGWSHVLAIVSTIISIAALGILLFRK